MAACIAGLVFVLRRLGRGGVVWRRIDAAGRMALTGYVVRSLVLTGLAEQWGFGHYGRFAHAALAELSYRWLSGFRMGPLEWLWRCGTHGRRLALGHPRTLVAP